MNAHEFLDQPLVARVAATGPDGPTIRPVWFLFEDGTLWWLTGAYSTLTSILDHDPRVAVVIDDVDLRTGRVHAVTMTGVAEVHPLDVPLATRKVAKYLGDDMASWPDRFRHAVDDPDDNWLISLAPRTPPRLRDLSFDPPSRSRTTGGA